MIEIVPNWHPIFVHFTVALLSLSVLFFIIQRPLAQTEIGDNFLVFARYALGLGILFTIGTVIAGIDAYNTVDHDTPSHLAMKDHRLWAIITASVFLIAWIWSLISLRGQDKAGWVLIVILLLGTGLLLTTGHKGSYLVYYYGLGVESLPEKDTHDHTAHDHGGGHEHSDGAEHQHEQGNGGEASESHEHGTSGAMETDSQAHAHEHTQTSEHEPEKAHEHAEDKAHDEHAHEHNESGESGSANAAVQSEVEVITDKDGIVRESLPAEEMPAQPVEQP